MPPEHTIRLLNQADLSAVLRLQARCYPEAYQEPAAAFLAKLQVSPATCWGIDHPGSTGDLTAYLFALPVQAGQWPTLHAADCPAPASPNSLYLHDLALHPDGRGQGWGQALLQQGAAHARQQGWSTLTLIAVQGSQPYWQKRGFLPWRGVASAQAVDMASGESGLASFGPQACPMVLPL